MPLELPKDRAAMIAKAIEADDGACSTGAMMADPAPVAAKPSLLDELAEVVRKASNELTHDARFFHNMALSVARRLLEREPGDKEVNDAVEEWQKEARTLDDYCRVIIKASRRAQLAELEGEVPT